MAVTSGVPQGSILGHLLAINGIFNVPLTEGSSLQGYADDLAFCRPVFDDKDCVIANKDLGRLHQWVVGQGFRLHPTKTKFMVISRKRHPPKPQLLVDGASVEQISTYKLLGVTISDVLSWSTHISHICLRGMRLLGNLYCNFKLCNSTASITYTKLLSALHSSTHQVFGILTKRFTSYGSKGFSPSLPKLSARIGMLLSRI